VREAQEDREVLPHVLVLLDVVRILFRLLLLKAVEEVAILLVAVGERMLEMAAEMAASAEIVDLAEAELAAILAQAVLVAILVV
jgi:hypothetical protein